MSQVSVDSLDIGFLPFQQPSIIPSQTTVSLSVRNLVSQIKAQDHRLTLENDKETQQLIEPLQFLLAQGRIKDVLRAVEDLGEGDIEILVNFLDQALDYLTNSKERAGALAFLSRITVANRIFPKRLLLDRIQYLPEPKAIGGSGKVHQGTDSGVCVKVMLQTESKLSATWIRELILWAHSSHPNILPFRGMFFENVGGIAHICFVSPFMKNGNLHEYAPCLAQKSRLPVVFDVINGIDYLHEWGIVHGDLKGQNVLISDEGRAMITDFGSSRVASTATVTMMSSSWTLHYAAPEVAAGGEKPTKKSDVWSFGCLCYEVMSLKPPYFQYKIDVQIVAALARNELPLRPGLTKVPLKKREYESDDDIEEFSDDEEERIEPINDEFWTLITQCCSPDPGKRLKVPKIQGLLTDMMNDSLADEEIEKRADDLAKREELLAEREVELKRREIDIKKQESDIRQKEADLAKRESEICRRESEVENLRIQLEFLNIRLDEDVAKNEEEEEKEKERERARREEESREQRERWEKEQRKQIEHEVRQQIMREEREKRRQREAKQRQELDKQEKKRERERQEQQDWERKHMRRY